MKLIEGAMFKLALRGTITLSEAKILRALEEKFACSYQSLCSETGIEMGEILAASKRLLSKGIIKEHYGVYFTEKIARMAGAMIAMATAFIFLASQLQFAALFLQ